MINRLGVIFSWSSEKKLSRQEISFFRRYSLKKAVPTQKRDSCESEVILVVVRGTDLEYASLFLTNVTCGDKNSGV